MGNNMKKKIFGKLGVFFLIFGVVLQMLVLVLPWVIYYYTGNWAYIILMFVVQMLVMPIVILICGLGGLICSILAYQRIAEKVRYIIMMVLSSLMTAFGGWLAFTSISAYIA